MVMRPRVLNVSSDRNSTAALPLYYATTFVGADARNRGFGSVNRSCCITSASFFTPLETASHNHRHTHNHPLQYAAFTTQQQQKKNRHISNSSLQLQLPSHPDFPIYSYKFAHPYLSFVSRPPSSPPSHQLHHTRLPLPQSNPIHLPHIHA